MPTLEKIRSIRLEYMILDEGRFNPERVYVQMTTDAIIDTANG